MTEYYKDYPTVDYLSPITVKRYQELIDDFGKYRKTGKILDIGCGAGLFLKEAANRGWEVYGTEYIEGAINKCRLSGIDVQQGKLNPAQYENNMFDVITSFKVIEHINNPIEEVQNIRHLLRPGGLFFFTTPNFNAVKRYLLKGKYNVLSYPEHLSYYTKKSINYLLVNRGFKKKKLTTTGFSITRFKTSLGKKEQYISETSSDEKVRLQFEKKGIMQFVKIALNGLLNLTGTGSSLKGWYIK